MNDFNEKTEYSSESFDREALHAITKTATVGLYSVETLIKKIPSDRTIKQKLEGHIAYYRDVIEKAKSIATDKSDAIYKLSLPMKAMIKCSVSTQYFCDESNSHIAKMMLKGIEMGVIEIISVKSSGEKLITPEIFVILEEFLSTLDLFEKDLKALL